MKAVNVRNSTMATASFSTDSPYTIEYRPGSTFRAENTLSVATGSVAEMSDAKDMDSSNDRDVTKALRPAWNSSTPVMTVAVTVPARAKMRTVPSWEKNAGRFSEYPDSKMMMGSRPRENRLLPSDGQTDSQP